MLSDPQTLYTGATAPAMNTTGTSRSFARTFLQGAETEYVFNDVSTGTLYKLHRNHNVTNKGRTRHLVEYSKEIVTADPLTADNVKSSAKVYMVIDSPPVGFSTSDLVSMTVEFLNYMLQGNSTLTKFIDGES